MSIDNKIIVKENKILKLGNILIRKLEINELMDTHRIIYMMESYVKSKSAKIIGPLINCTSSILDSSNKPKLVSKFIMQTETLINKVECPYELKDHIKTNKCLYTRFKGKEENLKYVYSKLGVYAFENNIKLKGTSYNVFLNKDINNPTIDVFMETSNY